MRDFWTRVKRISGNSFSHQLGVFLIFVVISGMLWVAMSLNEEVQRDIVCNVRVTNVPDSVTFISEPPRQLTVNVRARGTQMLRHLFGSNPTVDIDFRYYNRDNKLIVSRGDLRAIVQTAFGDDKTIQAVSPDTISVYYTTLPPLRVPVEVKARVSPSINMALLRPAVSLTDSVSVYAANVLAGNLTEIQTQPVSITDVNEDCIRRVALVTPRGCRVIPDSVDLKITVEPILTKTITVPVRIVNIPEGYDVMMENKTVDIKYRVARSLSDQIPEVDVVADFHSVPKGRLAGKVAIRPKTVNTNVIVTRDSINYVLTPNVSADDTAKTVESTTPVTPHE